MIPTITAFERSPDGGKGLTRDIGVRWALEEVGQPYHVRLVSFREMKERAHLRLHPFGKIPTYEHGDLALFESGAIVLHIAESHHGLLSADSKERAKAISWMFAALNTVEPPISDYENTRRLEGKAKWQDERLPTIEKRIHTRLAELSNWLGDAEWLEKDFSAGDLLMITILRRWKDLGLADNFSNLSDYIVRGQMRPAFQRAFVSQVSQSSDLKPV